MTPKYWTGIFVAMLAIFGIGLLVARGIHKGKDFVETNLSSIGLLHAHFRVDGDRIGDVERWQFMRSQPGRVDSAVLTVKVTGDAAALQEPGCLLRVTNAQPFGSNTRFQCTTARDSARLRLVPFGHVELLPEGTEVTMYVAGDAAANLQQHAYRGAGSDSGDVDINTTDGNLSINVNGQEIVHASGDSSGGSLIIRDPKTGRPIVQISGDSNGGSLKVIDSDGKTRVNLHGSTPKHDSARDH
jgi:hypothetical protein